MTSNHSTTIQDQRSDTPEISPTRRKALAALLLAACGALLYKLGSLTFWFLKPDGVKIGALRGYQETGAMLQVLEFVAERKYDTTATDQGSGKEKSGP